MTLTQNGQGYLIDGVEYPRITRILEVISRPGLEKWRARVGDDEANRIARKATDLGTEVHKAVEQIHTGQSVKSVLDTMQIFGRADLYQFVKAYGAWFEEAVDEVIAAERIVCSKKYGYAGTTDAVLWLKDGRMVVGDVKTSKTVSGEYRLQTSAYAIALREEGIPIDGRLILWLPSSAPGKFAAVDFDDYEGDRRGWLSALTLWKWNAEHGEDWRLWRA